MIIYGIVWERHMRITRKATGMLLRRSRRESQSLLERFLASLHLGCIT